MSILLLEQPRRGKTREAQVTPHKAEAAVWGIATPRDASVSETRHYNREKTISQPPRHRQPVYPHIETDKYFVLSKKNVFLQTETIKYFR